MSNQWHDNNVLSGHAQVDDDDDPPDDWETALEEKPKVSSVTEKSEVVTKAPPTTKKRANKKKFGDEEESSKTVQQPDGDYTPEQLDEIRKKEESEKESNISDQVKELVGKNSEHQSLDNLNLITKDEFLNYSLHLCNKLADASKSEFYSDFIDNFLEGITKSMSADGVKRLSTTLQTITLRKSGDEREKRLKSKAKAKAKPQLKTIRRTDYGALGGDGENDFDQDADYDEDDFT